MIRLARPEDAARLLALAACWPAIGALVEMYWRMQAENPRLPHRFYLIDDSAVLRIGGARATMCGTVANPEEVAAFLRVEHVSQMTAGDFFPPGWRLLETNRVLLRAPAPFMAEPPPPGFDPAPSMEAVMAVLESQDGRMSPPAARDFFYADANARRNHGAAWVPGIWAGETLAATAGAWAVTGREVYVACVETRLEARGRGHARALLGQLCARYGAQPMSLLCRGEMLPFYAPFGFRPAPGLGLISLDPEQMEDAPT